MKALSQGCTWASLGRMQQSSVLVVRQVTRTGRVTVVTALSQELTGLHAVTCADEAELPIPLSFAAGRPQPLYRGLETSTMGLERQRFQKGSMYCSLGLDFVIAGQGLGST